MAVRERVEVEAEVFGCIIPRGPSRLQESIHEWPVTVVDASRVMLINVLFETHVAS